MQVRLARNRSKTLKYSAVGIGAARNTIAHAGGLSARKCAVKLLSHQEITRHRTERALISLCEGNPWGVACNEDGTFKSADELRKIYTEKGVTIDKPAYAYCRIGERSSLIWFVLKYLLG
jgi:hypothetical protein